MKKRVTKLLFTGIVAFSLQASAQSSKTVSASAVSVTNTQVMALTEQNGISVSYQNGSSDAGMMMCLIFKNTDNEDNNFTWKLKDKNGNTVYESNPVKIAAGQSIDMNNTGGNNTIFTVALKSGMTVNDYSIEITPKK